MPVLSADGVGDVEMLLLEWLLWFEMRMKSVVSLRLIWMRQLSVERGIYRVLERG